MPVPRFKKGEVASILVDSFKVYVIQTYNGQLYSGPWVTFTPLEKDAVREFLKEASG